MKITKSKLTSIIEEEATIVLAEEHLAEVMNEELESFTSLFLESLGVKSTSKENLFYEWVDGLSDYQLDSLVYEVLSDSKNSVLLESHTNLTNKLILETSQIISDNRFKAAKAGLGWVGRKLGIGGKAAPKAALTTPSGALSAAGRDRVKGAIAVAAQKRTAAAAAKKAAAREQLKATIRAKNGIPPAAAKKVAGDAAKKMAANPGKATQIMATAGNKMRAIGAKIKGPGIPTRLGQGLNAAMYGSMIYTYLGPKDKVELPPELVDPPAPGPVPPTPPPGHDPNDPNAQHNALVGGGDADQDGVPDFVDIDQGTNTNKPVPGADPIAPVPAPKPKPRKPRANRRAQMGVLGSVDGVSSIRDIQNLMVRVGHGRLLGKYGVDNKYGRKTASAIRAFQGEAGISPATGIFGPAEAEAMNRLHPQAIYGLSNLRLSTKMDRSKGLYRVSGTAADGTVYTGSDNTREGAASIVRDLIDMHLSKGQKAAKAKEEQQEARPQTPAQLQESEGNHILNGLLKENLFNWATNKKIKG